MKDILQGSDEFTRRAFMASAARTCLGVGIAAGPGAALLRAADAPVARDAGVAGKAKHVIYVYLAGGMSHIDTFDPKPGQPTAGEFSPIKSAAPDIQISEKLPGLAKQADRIAVIRSMTSKQGAHERGNYLMHTSYPPLGTIRHPAMGAWALKLAGRMNKTLPGNVLIGGGRNHAGAGFFPSEFEPLLIGDPNRGLQNVTLPGGVSESQFASRQSLLDRLDAGFRARYPHSGVKAYNKFYDEALNLMHSEDLTAFNLGDESSDAKSAYGSDRFGQGCLLARRLVQHGVRFVEVTSGGWDTHQDNFERLGTRLLPVLDQALAALIGDLSKIGLLDETLIVLTTEFGRTPKINERSGRDHYPKVFSAMVAGGGVKGGQVYGKSDETGSTVADSPVAPEDLNATIGYALGVDARKHFMSPEGRPFAMGGITGKPLTALF